MATNLQFSCLIVGILISCLANTSKLFGAIKTQLQEDRVNENGDSQQWNDIQIVTVFCWASIGYFLVPAGIIYDRLGLRGVQIYGLVLTVTGFGCIYGFYDKPWGPWVYGLMLSLAIQGGYSLNYGTIWTNGKVWPPASSGVIVGIIMCFYAGGATGLVQIYKAMLPHGLTGLEKIEKGREPTKHFILLWMCLVAVVGSIVTLALPMLYNAHLTSVVKEVQLTDKKRANTIRDLAAGNTESTGTQSLIASTTAASPVVAEEKPAMPMSQLVLMPELWLVISIYTFSDAFGIAWGANLRSFINATYADEKDKEALGKFGLTVLSFVYLLEAFARLSSGISADYLARFSPRPAFFAALCTLFALTNLIVAFVGKPYAVPHIFVAAFCYASLGVSLPAYIRQTFDIKRYGLVIGMGYSALIPGIISYSLLLANFSEREKQRLIAIDPKVDMCMGHNCYKTSLMIVSCMAIIPIAMSIAITLRDSRRKAQEKQTLPYDTLHKKTLVRRSTLGLPEYHPNLEAEEKLQNAAYVQESETEALVSGIVRAGSLEAGTASKRASGLGAPAVYN